MNAWNRVGAMLAVTIACAGLATSPGRAATPRAITLAEALVMAQRNDLGVVRADGGAQNARASVRSAWGAFLPNLSLSAGTTKQLTGAGSTRVENGQVVVTSRQPWSTNLGTSASLTLFDGGRRFFDMGQARANRVSAEVDAATARWQAALGTKQAFFNVLAARETQLAAAAQLEQAGQQRGRRVRAHAREGGDALRLAARRDLDAERPARGDAGGHGSGLRERGARARGGFAGARDRGDGGFPGIGDARARRFDARAARGRRAQRSCGARGARRGAGGAEGGVERLPAVRDRELVARRQRHRRRAGVGTRRRSITPASLRFGLTFPLFDQFGREAQLTQTAVALRDAEASLRDTRLAARQALTDGLGGFHEATQRVASEAATVDAADEDLRVQRDRYSLGGSTLLDVLSSQAALDQARRDLIPRPLRPARRQGAARSARGQGPVKGGRA
jgi:outer membrane protein